MTIYLLGGAATSGKSTIAKRLLRTHGVPFLPLDYLMIGVARGLFELGVDPAGDEFEAGDLLWPIVRGMVVQALYERASDYLFEGAQLRPQHARELLAEFPGRVRACFLGFAEVDSKAKLAQVRRFGGGRARDDWSRWDDSSVIVEIERLKAFSQRLRAECRESGVRYVEVSVDLEGTVAAVIRQLTGADAAGD